MSSYPKGKVLIPDVAGHASDLIERPELVAERLLKNQAGGPGKRDPRDRLRLGYEDAVSVEYTNPTTGRPALASMAWFAQLGRAGKKSPFSWGIDFQPADVQRSPHMVLP